LSGIADKPHAAEKSMIVNNNQQQNNKMKQYRISIPAIVNISVAAESEEQAKRLAAAATYTPDSPLSSLERNSFNNLLDVAVWVNDEVSENPDKCEVLEAKEFVYDPRKLEHQLEEFALSNGSSREYYKALND
jgi:hypothetical protein